MRTLDGRQALLLPDLEGVDTAEQQLRITCRKGSIDPDNDRTVSSGFGWSATTDGAVLPRSRIVGYHVCCVWLP